MKEEMEYTFLSAEEQFIGVQNRIKELESEHFSNEVFITEAKIVGETQTITQLISKNILLNKRISVLKDKLIELDPKDQK